MANSLKLYEIQWCTHFPPHLTRVNAITMLNAGVPNCYIKL